MRQFELRMGTICGSMRSEGNSAAGAMREVLDYAGSLLRKRDYSRAEITTKLETKGFCPTLTAEAVKKLADNGLLQEAHLVEKELVASRGLKARGDALIRDRLLKRGISLEMIDAALEHPQYPAEILRAHELIRLKYPRGITVGQTARFLMSRGFSAETIESLFGALDIAFEPYPSDLD